MQSITSNDRQLKLTFAISHFPKSLIYGILRFMKSLLSQIVSDLKKYSPDKIILFGSQARREADRFSDFDILVLKETKKRFLERLREAILLLRNTLPPVNLFVYNSKEFKNMKQVKNPFIQKALKEGKVLYEAK